MRGIRRISEIASLFLCDAVKFTGDLYNRYYSLDIIYYVGTKIAISVCHKKYMVQH